MNNVELLIKLAKDNSVLLQLLRAKQLSDKKNYSEKAKIINQLLKNNPGEFRIDSRQVNTVGLTHEPTGFKIHTTKGSIPLEFTKQEAQEKQAGTPAWQRSAGKNPEGGLNAKGRASYNKATGGNLKPPVTESNPKGERAKRQNSFCSRMCGMKRVNTGSATKNDPDSRINKALRKWNCKCGEAHDTDLQKLACIIKEGRCWAGYEPVPGKEPYSEDSCRPIAKKKKEEDLEKESSSKPGLWANILAKRKRGEKPAKPGDEAYPDKEQWNKLTKDK